VVTADILKNERKIRSNNDLQVLLLLHLMLSILLFSISIFFILGLFFYSYGNLLWLIFAVISGFLSIGYFNNSLNIYYSKNILLALINITNGYLSNFKFFVGFEYQCDLNLNEPPKKIKIEYCSGEGIDYMSIIIKNTINSTEVNGFGLNPSIHLLHYNDLKVSSIEFPILPSISITDIVKAFNMIRNQRLHD